MSQHAVTVLGSANADLVLPVRRLPAPGETVLAGPRRGGPGGKGLNQAVAAARAGATTAFVATVGQDAEADLVRRVLDAEGITPVLTRVSAPTGLAVVLLDAHGENSIVVAPGANAVPTAATDDALDAVRRSSVLLMQLEVPLSLVTQAAATAREAGVQVMLNAAPAIDIHADAFANVDVLVVNEGEALDVAGTATGVEIKDLDSAMAVLLTLVPSVVVTRGAAGADYRHRDGTSLHEPAPQVAVVDTTAAGDTFTGYLAAAMSAGSSVTDALRLACAAGALCVGRDGAVASVPRRSLVDRLLGQSH